MKVIIETGFLLEISAPPYASLTFSLSLPCISIRVMKSSLGRQTKKKRQRENRSGANICKYNGGGNNDDNNGEDDDDGGNDGGDVNDNDVDDGSGGGGA